MVGRLLSFWEGLLSGAMLNSQGVAIWGKGYCIFVHATITANHGEWLIFWPDPWGKEALVFNVSTLG